jgi:hypothetical protein
VHQYAASQLKNILDQFLVELQQIYRSQQGVCSIQLPKFPRHSNQKKQAMKTLTKRSKYSHHQKKLLVDGLPETYPLPPSSSNAWKHE